MNKFPRFLTFLIAAAIVSTTLSGCGGGKKKNPVSAVSSSSSASKSEYSNWGKSVEARTALDNKDYATVESLARKRISDKPDDASAHFLLGQALMGQNNYRAARKSLETACSLVPDNLNYSREYCKSIEALAKESTEKKEYTDAISLYKKLMEKDYEPTKTEEALSDVYIASAKKMIAAGDISDAEIVLTEGANLLKKDTPLRLELSKLYINDDRLMEAERLLKRLVNNNPDNSDCLVAYAKLLQKMGDVNEAAEIANKALSINPSNSEALAIKGNMNSNLDSDAPAIIFNPVDTATLSLEAINERIKFFERSGNLIEEKKLLNYCLEKYPNETGVYYKLAEVEDKLGNIDDALASIEKYNSIVPDSSEGQFFYAKCLCQKGQCDSALSILSKIENTYADKQALMNERGQALARKGDFNAAIETWNAVLKDNPTNADALFYLGQLASESGKHDEASKYYDSAIKQQPFNNKFRYFAGLNYIQSGNKDKAAALWSLSKGSLNPSDPYAARIIRAMGDDSELQAAAITNYNNSIPSVSAEDANARVITIDGSAPVAGYEVSEMPSSNDYYQALEYARSGNFAEAERLFRQVIANDPNNFNAMMNLGKIFTATQRNNIAAAIFLKALKIDSRNIHALRAVANSYSEVGMHSLASQISEQVRTNFPDQFQDFPVYENKAIKNDPRAIEPMASALIQEGLYDEALAVVQGAITEQSENNNLYLLQGDVYKNMKLFDLAMESYRHVQNSDSESPTSFIKAGDLYLAAGQSNQALTEYRKAMNTTYIDPDSMLYISDRYAQMGRPNDSRSILAKLKTMNLNMEQIKKLDKRLGTNFAEETASSVAKK